MGLRFRATAVRELVQGARSRRESSTNQAILQEGRVQGVEEGRAEGVQVGRAQGVHGGQIVEARDVLVRLGTLRFGAPDPSILSQLGALESLETLHQLQARLMQAGSWRELLASR